MSENSKVRVSKPVPPLTRTAYGGRPYLPELHLRRFALPGFVDREVRHRLAPEHPCKHVPRERLYRGVVVADARVVVPARELDLVLRRRDLLLQLREVLRRLEVGVGLGNGEERLQGPR